VLVVGCLASSVAAASIVHADSGHTQAVAAKKCKKAHHSGHKKKCKKKPATATPPPAATTTAPSTTTPVPDPQPGELVIDELMQDPVSPLDDTNDEYVEFVNVTGHQIDLTGATLDTCSLVGLVQPGEFFLVSKRSNVGEDFVCVFTLANTSDTVTIRNSGSTVIDAVSYTSTTAGRSRSLDPAHRDATANDSDASWCPTPVDGQYLYQGFGVQSSNYGTPGLENPSCP
jgi:hypothetical protein